ncbi:MAG: immune inhibitor A [Chloroflexi bacterium]|nr:immune inhibitor A [Chloroflexota bacterium]
MNENRGVWIGIGIGGLLLVCLCCFLVAGAGAFAGWLNAVEGEYTFEGDFDFGTATPPPVIIRPTETDGTSGFPQEALENLARLMAVEVPINDPVNLAERLLGVTDIPATFPDPNAPYSVGAQKQFWVTNTDSNQAFQVTASLRYATDHAYFWIENGVRYDADELRSLAEVFENDIYPTTREFFGSEWSPGIDEDPHIYILYTGGVGFSTAGYFSSVDSVHPLASEYSNAHEMFVFNADNTPLDDTYTAGVLAHEFQHMIHWYLDRNETSWINEGFSELSVLLNGFDPGGFDRVFIRRPDQSLNDWPNDGDTGSYYGSSFLFVTYYLGRFGEEATQLLASDSENGLESVDGVLETIGATDPLTGAPIRADDLVLDWVITNYVQDRSVGDGRYTYPLYDGAPRASDTETISDCTPGNPQVRTVNQYGTDYIRITCPGQHTLRFEGSLVTSLLPVQAHAGDYFFWSNKGDESDMTLTRAFDFSGVSGPITFSYWTWYDIEADYDYVYLLASADGGQTWEFILTPSGTAEDPSGNSYGWGYNDLSGNGPSWIEESVDLSAYAGQEVLLRFEYVTDAAVNGEGLMLDDLSIPAIGYSEGFESDEGGWEAAGWVRATNLLPQYFRLALVVDGRPAQVVYLTLNEDNTLELPLDLTGDVDEVTLVVLGATRFTRQNASYQVEFLP